MKQLQAIVNVFLLLGFIANAAIAQEMSREEKVRADKQKVEGDGLWLYNNLGQAYEKARETGKPILVSLRCIPCEECVKLDDDLVDSDPAVRPLLEQFVCVRIVGTNGLDLDVFQYDTDQSFAMFMLNADKTVYGRFGTRSHRTEWIGDVSIKGMAAALQGALDLHASYPASKSQLVAKRGESLEFASPELYPTLKGKFTDSLDYEGDVVKSCIHCHQIGDARRDFYWHRDLAIPEELVFPYPHPKSIGLVLDPNKKATVIEVVADSPAADAGLRAGDEVARMNGQPLLSMADVQWVLHQTSPAGGTIGMEVQRGGQSVDLSLNLAAGWRRNDDPSWRVAAWGHARTALGGMRLSEMTADEQKAAGITSGLALKVKSAGKYGAHAAARKAGIRPDDILISYNGKTDFKREADVIFYASQELKPGQKIPVRVQRGGKQLDFKLPIQK